MKNKYTLTAIAALMITTGYAQKRSTVEPQFRVAGQEVTVKSSERPNWLDQMPRGGVANDECSGAIMVDVTTSCEPTAATFAGATESMEASECSGWTASEANDVWFYFVATSANSTIIVNGDPEVDPTIEVFSGDCGGLESITCVDATLEGDTEELIIATEIGTTYYYRTYFWPYEELPTDFSFSTCVIETPAAPENDLCENATVQTLDAGSSITATGTSIGALDTEELGVETVWEAFTLSECSDVYISYCGTDPESIVAVTAITSACPVATNDDIIAEIIGETESCENGQYTGCYRNLPAGTYYVPVASGAETYVMEITASACITDVPANDDCADATVLTPGVSCEPVMASGDAATESMPGEECNGFEGSANDDVWFSFVATDPDMVVAVQGTLDYDAVVLVMSGSCGSMSTIACADATLDGEMEEVELTDLEVGTTYFVRVYHWYDVTACDNTFSICVVEGSSVGMQENEAAAWSVFPNPTNGMFTVVNGGHSAQVDLQVIDLRGRTVYSSRVQMNEGAQHVLDLTGKVSAGSYSLRIVEGDRSHVQKLMVN